MDPRINRTKNLLKQTLRNELELEPLSRITVTQLCAKSTINKTTFYRHYTDLYELYQDVLTDIFNEGLDSVCSDYSVFFEDPKEFFAMNIRIRQSEIFIYFKKQLQENPVDLFDNLYPDLLKERVYAQNLIPKSADNDLKLEIAIKALRGLMQENKEVSLEKRSLIWESMVVALFK